MLQTHSFHARPSAFDHQLSAIQSQIAEHMIGQTVGLLVGSKKILHGIVTGVLSEAGKPKIVVNGRRYELQQVLSAEPAALN